MKLHFWHFGMAAVVATSILHFEARADISATRVEVPIGRVFVPAQGYDDNDTIQIVLDGVLPNSCYTLADHTVSVDASSLRVEAHLYANLQKDGPCSNPNSLPPSIHPYPPYTIEVTLGSLAMGTYTVFWPRPGLSSGERTFQVVE